MWISKQEYDESGPGLSTENAFKHFTSCWLEMLTESPTNAHGFRGILYKM
jgi:hypothetical protein